MKTKLEMRYETRKKKKNRRKGEIKQQRSNKREIRTIENEKQMIIILNFIISKLTQKIYDWKKRNNN